MLDGVLGPLTTRDWYVFPVAFALAGRLDWLVPAAAVGAHVFWLVTLVLLARVLRAAQLQGSAPRVASSARAARRARRAARASPSGAGVRGAAACDASCAVVAAPESATSTNGCASDEGDGEPVDRHPARRPRAARRAARASSGRSFGSVSRPLACTSFTITPSPASCAVASRGRQRRLEDVERRLHDVEDALAVDARRERQLERARRLRAAQREPDGAERAARVAPRRARRAARASPSAPDSAVALWIW